MTDAPATPSVATRAAEARDAPPTFAEIYEAQFDFVWRSARRLGVPDSSVDDAVQETFVIVHKRLAEFEWRSSVRTWLFGIVRNVARELRRTTRRRDPSASDDASRTEPDELLASPEERPDRAVERSAANRVLHTLLDELDEEKREVFVLAEIEQMSMPEIAEALAINVNTAYSRLRLAREAFAASAARFRAREKGKRA